MVEWYLGTTMSVLGSVSLSIVHGFLLQISLKAVARPLHGQGDKRQVRCERLGAVIRSPAAMRGDGESTYAARSARAQCRTS